TEDIRAQIAGSLFDDQPFDPIIKVDENKVRIENIILTKEKLTLKLFPIP
ncbi:unnamed protein product, partial [marine sediment metagenome]